MELPRGLYVSDRRILLDLVRACQILEVGVYVDGVYTILDEGGLRSDWIDGHEVYFKVEGRIDRVAEKAE